MTPSASRAAPAVPRTKRCQWAGNDPLMIAYHDQEWGVASHDDEHLFEMLILEGAQAGLSWTTILKKRDNYRRLFANFDPQKIARFSAARQEKLLQDEGIVRNRAKVAATVDNARALLKLKKEFATFDEFIWQFVGGRPLQNNRKSLADIPGQTAESVAMSKELKRRGFRFVGPTICYAFMQAVGMVNDHQTDCFRYKQLK